MISTGEVEALVTVGITEGIKGESFGVGGGAAGAGEAGVGVIDVGTWRG